MIRSGIYKITSPSGKIYIGQSVDLVAREKVYKRNNCKKQVLLFNSIKKYGWSSHRFEIIELCSESELSSRERHYILVFSSFDSKHGLNLTEGGGVGTNLSTTQKKKISESLRGHIVSEEARNKIRLANIGKKHSAETIKKMKSHIVSQERRDKIRERLTGCKISEEQKEKISNTLMGHPVSEETRNKLRLARLGVKDSKERREATSRGLMGNKHMVGKTLSEETKRKMRERQQQRRRNEAKVKAPDELFN